MIGTILTKKFMKDENLQKVFNEIDQDGDGFISED